MARRLALALLFAGVASGGCKERDPRPPAGGATPARSAPSAFSDAAVVASVRRPDILERAVALVIHRPDLAERLGPRWCDALVRPAPCWGDESAPDATGRGALVEPPHGPIPEPHFAADPLDLRILHAGGQAWSTRIAGAAGVHPWIERTGERWVLPDMLPSTDVVVVREDRRMTWFFLLRDAAAPRAVVLELDPPAVALVLRTDLPMIDGKHQTWAEGLAWDVPGTRARLSIEPSATTYPILAAIELDLPETPPAAPSGPVAWHRALEEGPGARDGHAMAYDVARKRVVLFGGARDTSPDRVWEYDGVGWHGTPLVASPVHRRDLPGAHDAARGRTLFFGGADLDAKPAGDTWLWDGTRATRASSPSSPPARYWSAMAYDARRERVVLVGGTGSDQPGACRYDCDSTWEWDGKTWSQKTPTPAPSPRWGHEMAYDAARHEVVLFGGSSYVGGCGLEGCGDTWEWDGARWLARAAPGPSKRRFAAMAFDASRQRVVLFGGTSDACADKTCGDTWEWDGERWTAVHPSRAPSPRAQHTMAYDEARRRVVLYGGGAPDGRKSDTWEWDGSTWTPRWQPPGVAGAELAYDPVSRRVLLFGGHADDDQDGRTYAWNGAAWELRPGASPPARDGHAMVADPARKRVVLFGGESVACGATPNARGTCGDTWFWDGERWSRASGPGPSPRSGHAMAYDAERSRVVLFGGRSGNAASTETWEHDGQRWSKASDDGPGGFDVGRMAYDVERRRLVLVRSSGTWEREGSAWVEKPGAKLPVDRAAIAYDANLRKVVAFGGTSPACAGGRCDDLWQWDGRSWSVVDLADRPPRRIAHAVAYDEARSELVVYGGVDREYVKDTWVLRARR